MERKKILLFVLLGVFAVALTYRLMNPYEQMRTSEAAVGKGRPVPPVRNLKSGGERPLQASKLVAIEDFLNPSPHSGEMSRDIFSEKRETAPQEANPNTMASVQPEGQPAPEDPRAQVGRDLSGLKIFGTYKKGKEKGLFLERGKEILVIHQGDRIDGKYLVKEITEKGLTLRAEFLNEDVHIDLSDF